MKANDTTINILLQNLCKYAKYRLTIIKYYNDQKKRISTKYVLYNGSENIIECYSKRRLVVGMMEEWQQIKHNETS